MTSPLPPRLRDTRSQGDRVRQDRNNLRQLGVGFVGGRYAPARPLGSTQQLGEVEDDSAADEAQTTAWEDGDRHVVAFAGPQVFVQSHEPTESSLFVRWHPLGLDNAGLPWPSERWTLDGNLVTIADPDGLIEPRDAFSSQYEYLLGDASPLVQGTFGVDSRVTGTQHTGITLDDGESYVLTVVGTFNIYGAPPIYGTSVPMLYPSPGGPGVVAQQDVEWAYGNAVNLGGFPHAVGTPLEYDIGSGWTAWGTATAAPRSDRTYTKTVTGQGSELLLRFVDGMYTDNDGVLRVTVGQE